jgi:predicted amidohydrolase
MVRFLTMDSSFRLACAQMDCKLGDVKANLRKIQRISREISRTHPDIAVFPELATTGYLLREKWVELAEEIPGISTDQLSKIASEHGFYLVCGMDEKDSKSAKVFDSAVLINPNGKLEGIYRKVHLWDSEKNYFSRGKGFPVFKTKYCILGIGICYDLEFPETARTMSKAGADLLLFPSAEIDPMSAQIDSYLLSRSAENCVFVGFANRIGRETGGVSFFGHTRIISPDARINTITSRDGFVVSDLDLELLAKLRKKQLPYLDELQQRAYNRS